MDYWNAAFASPPRTEAVMKRPYRPLMRGVKAWRQKPTRSDPKPDIRFVRPQSLVARGDRSGGVDVPKCVAGYDRLYRGLDHASKNCGGYGLDIATQHGDGTRAREWSSVTPGRKREEARNSGAVGTQETALLRVGGHPMLHRAMLASAR